MSIKSLFEDIADAIREKSGSSDTYTPAEMPSAIRSIPSGSSTASGVSYDSTSSGLTASNVQDAIDELAGDVSTITSDLSALHPIGTIIHTTVCNTMAKVVETYGGTTWIQHTGYVLRGADSGVTANQATKDGGNDDTVVVQHEHSVSVSGGNHRHTWSGPLGRNAYPQDISGQATDKWYGSKNAYTEYSGSLSMSGTAANNTNWSDGTNANIPNYKSVYIWERTA